MLPETSVSGRSLRSEYGICLGEELDAPIVDAEEEKPHDEAIKVLCSHEIDVGNGVGRKKRFPVHWD